MIVIHNDISRKRNHGPRISTAALQRHLKKMIRQNKISWVRFSNKRKYYEDAINWIWGIGGDGIKIIVECEKKGIPYIVGPNILFEQGRPLYEHEMLAINSRHCLGYFYLSDSHGDLIKQYLSDQVVGKMYQFFKPVWPVPKMFKEIKYDLLIYLKHGEEAKKIFQDFKRTEFYKQKKVVEFIYGAYKKRHLYKAARASHVCLYLSYGESGGMATEEIMSCGCPIVSMKRDTPLGVNKKTVNWISEEREIPELIQAIKECERYDRLEVRNTALSRFGIDTSAKTVLAHLKEINGLWEDHYQSKHLLSKNKY